VIGLKNLIEQIEREMAQLLLEPTTTRDASEQSELTLPGKFVGNACDTTPGSAPD